MKHDCFSVLHPWAYDLDSVDYKYIISKDQVNSIMALAPSKEVRVFWLSFFKAQLSCTSDEFVNALREVNEMACSSSVFQATYPKYEEFMVVSDFSISLKDHAAKIEELVKDCVHEGKYNVLQNQI